MAESIAQWDPLEVLKIDSIFTCSGWAHSKGRKCNNRIAKENRELATEIMEDMGERDIRSSRFKSALKSLATPLLCRAYHVKDTEQHARLQRQWGKHIEAYKASMTAPVARSSRGEGSRSPRGRAANHESAQTPSSTTYQAVGVRVESLQEEVVALRAAFALLSQRTAETASPVRDPSDLPRSPSPRRTRVQQATDPATERQSTQVDIPSVQHPRPLSAQSIQNAATRAAASSPQNTASAEPNLPRRAGPVSPNPTVITEARSTTPASQVIPETTRSGQHETTPSEQPTATTADTVPPTPEQRHSRQSSRHGRRAIEGDCSICCEAMHSEDNISWCKSTCGQNFHADCVGTWLATLPEGYGTCPYCRVQWAD